MGLQYLCITVVSLCMVMASASTDPSPGCTRECNGKSVSYPFGLSGDPAECYKDSSFELTCNHSFSPPELQYGNIPVLNISLQEGTIVLEVETAFSIYNESGVQYRFNQEISLGTNSSFRFSSTGNKFIVISCDTIGTISDWNLDQFGTGCLALCTKETDIKNPIDLPPNVAACSGIGCCQTLIPNDLTTLVISLSSFTNHSGLLNSNPVDFGYVSGLNLSLIKKNRSDGVHYFSQVVVDWAIRDMTCEQQGERICGPNTDCININSADGGGYRCSCKQGFQLGNPYNPTGCIDIDECLAENKIEYPCKGKCKNTRGNYTCQCSFGYNGDGKVGCRLKTIIKILAGIGVSIVLVGFTISFYWVYKKKTKERNQYNNGGWLLERLEVKVYKEMELEKATNSFSTQRLLGEGGNGVVYKGLLMTRSEKDGVAIKTYEIEVAVKISNSKVVGEKQVEQFLNEVNIVSKVNHKNVVKLFGLCLETKVPMLVYEYVPNGTLYDHIGKLSALNILGSWSRCLSIVIGTARALHYMHFEANTSIIHHDIKSANILLDANYIAKVSNFGSSKLTPNPMVVLTEVEGTLGYLDPEYILTGELTAKSDVYGFGVVLMELLTKKKPVARAMSGEMVSNVKEFIEYVQDNRIAQVLKVGRVDVREMEEIHIVAKIAVKCLAMSRRCRPTMIEVKEELNKLCYEYHITSIEVANDETVKDELAFVTSRLNFEVGQSW